MTYLVDHPSYSGGHTRGSTHSCASVESYRVVLAGETLFDLISTDVDDLIREDATIELAIGLAYAPYSTKVRAQTTVSWRGKLRMHLLPVVDCSGCAVARTDRMSALRESGIAIQ